MSVVNSLKNFLNKPFPFIDTKEQRLVAVIFISLFIFGFLYIFQPFGLAAIVKDKALIIAGYASILNYHTN